MFNRVAKLRRLMKQYGSSKVNSAFHHSEVDQMSTRNSWVLSGKNHFVVSL